MLRSGLFGGTASNPSLLGLFNQMNLRVEADTCPLQRDLCVTKKLAQGFALNVSSSNGDGNRLTFFVTQKTTCAPELDKHKDSCEEMPHAMVLLIFRASHLETLTAHGSHHCPHLRENATVSQEGRNQAKTQRNEGLTIL